MTPAICTSFEEREIASSRKEEKEREEEVVVMVTLAVTVAATMVSAVMNDSHFVSRDVCPTTNGQVL